MLARQGKFRKYVIKAVIKGAFLWNGMIRTRISDPKSLGACASKEPMNLCPE